jgi:hydroxyethylthiazole kinase
MRTGADLAAIRERKPLVHQITNYVVMNETANATLSLGALPVMAHAVEEVEEMASVAGALVLNIGTLSERWIEAMLLAAKAANRAGAPVVLDPVGAGATRFRTETAQRILEESEIAVVRGNQAEVATLAGRQAEIRGVESIRASDSAADLAKVAASELGCVVSVTGPVDHVSDGERSIAVSNGHELLGTVSGTGDRRRSPRRVRGSRRGRGQWREGTRHVPRQPLRRALQPRPGHPGRAGSCGRTVTLLERCLAL